MPDPNKDKRKEEDLEKKLDDLEAETAGFWDRLNSMGVEYPNVGQRPERTGAQLDASRDRLVQQTQAIPPVNYGMPRAQPPPPAVQPAPRPAPPPQVPAPGSIDQAGAAAQQRIRAIPPTQMGVNPRPPPGMGAPAAPPRAMPQPNPWQTGPMMPRRY